MLRLARPGAAGSKHLMRRRSANQVSHRHSERGQPWTRAHLRKNPWAFLQRPQRALTPTAAMTKILWQGEFSNLLTYLASRKNKSIAYAHRMGCQQQQCEPNQKNVGRHRGHCA